MRQTMNHGRLALALGLLLASVASAAFVTPASAQSSRFRVLVAPPMGNAKQGAKVADLVRKSIDQMNTHVSIPEKEVKAALKKFGMKESEANCITYRQLMGNVDAKLDAKLVMCSEVDASGQMSAQFFNPDGSSYDVEKFAITSEAEAAEKVTTGFGNYVNMLSRVTYCDDYLRSSQWQEALDNCNQALELNPKSTRALYGKASALMQLERHEEALAAFQKVIELEPINQDAILAAAIEASKLGQEEQYRKYLNEYLTLNPGDVNVRLSIASKMMQEGAPEAALHLMESVDPADTVNVQVREVSGHFAMGAAAKLANAGPADGNSNAAQPFFEKAVRHYSFVAAAKGDTTPLSVNRNMLVALGALNRTDEAVALGSRITARPDVDGATWASYADQLRAAKKYSEALAAYDKARQMDTAQKVLSRKAFIYVDQGNVEGVVSTVKQGAANKEIPETMQDALAQNLIKIGFDNFQKAKKFESAYAHYAAARDIATSERTKAMANFMQGIGIYEQAVAVQDAATVTSAKAAKPMFERARTFLEGAGAYTDQAATRASFLKNITQYIERQEALMRLGK